MNEIQIIEYNNVRVITTKQVAEAYGASPKKVSNNFNANKSRYTEGKHYFVLRGDELKDLCSRNSGLQNSSAKTRKFYLWTERGALLLAKSINTDTAWDAYERLVDFYFEKKLEHPVSVAASSELCSIPERSLSPVPKRSGWYQQNKELLRKICDALEISHKELYHQLLKRLGEIYDLQAANEIYKKERGFYPEYAIDIIGYFPELEKTANKLLAKLSILAIKK